jgi:hypothetical protein
MCFTNLLGVVTLLVIIIAKASILSYSEQHRVNLSADPISNDHQANTSQATYSQEVQHAP